MDNVSSKFSEQLLGNCCGCVPIRTGVLLYAVLLLIDSCFSLTSFVSDDTRIYVGGFTYHTRVIVGFLGFIGIFLCLLGILGERDNSPVLLKMFYQFSIIRIVVVFSVLAIDLGVLLKCEKWRPAVSMRQDEYNPIMDMVAQSGLCDHTRRWYLILGALDLILSSYWSWVTRWYLSVIENCPSYLISLNHAKAPEFYSGYANLSLNEQDRFQQRVEEGVQKMEDGAVRFYHSVESGEYKEQLRRYEQQIEQKAAGFYHSIPGMQKK